MAALVGQAIALETTVGSFREGHLNQTAFECGSEVALAERLSVGKSEGNLQGFAIHLATDCKKEVPDLGGDLGGDLCEGIRDHSEHEGNERH